jgi:hypothetical protein
MASTEAGLFGRAWDRGSVSRIGMPPSATPKGHWHAAISLAIHLNTLCDFKAIQPFAWLSAFYLAQLV